MAKTARRTSARPRRRRTPIQASRQVLPSEKAAFHQITGAGRSRVLRQFFGLSAADEEVITQQIAQGLDRLIEEANGRQ